MPRFDGTGPRGMGSGTGRRMGPCYNQAYAGPMGYGYRRGYGQGAGAVGYNATTADKEWLQNRKSDLEQELQSINDQLKK